MSCTDMKPLCQNTRDAKKHCLFPFCSMGKKKKVSKHLNVSSTSSSASPSQPEFNRSASMPAEKFSKARIPVSPEEGAIAEHGYVPRIISHKGMVD